MTNGLEQDKRLRVGRYDVTQRIFTQLDPVLDVRNFVSYLAIPDYLEELLISKHGLSNAGARERATLVCPHVEVALDFFDQLRGSADTIGFLPAYYMTLNLMKACILVGKRWTELQEGKNYRHGVSYQNRDERTFNVLEERLKIYREGVFPLFYSTLTGEDIACITEIAMDDVYRFLNATSAEYEIATKRRPALVFLECKYESDERRRPIRPILSVISDPPPDLSIEKLQVLKGFSTGNNLVFRGEDLPLKEKYSYAEMNSTVLFDNQMRRCLMYHDLSDHGFFTPVNDAPLLMPEEFPIALMLFHMSNVVRYKPDALYRTRSSRYWPLLSASLRHTTYQFLVLFWSFIHQTKLTIVREQTSHIT